MKLMPEYIGTVMTGKTKNGYSMTVTIKDDKRLFKLYKNLGLDIFEKSKKRESSESNNEQ